MAKVTVYVTDEQLERLKVARGLGKGGMSKAFQAFLETAIGGEAPAGRYDYARKLMPVSAAIDAHRRRLARKVEEGGPPADGGPVATALTLLLYKELLARDPDVANRLEKEFVRFGLDELVSGETDGVDLLTEPEPDEAEISEDDNPFGFAVNIGDELRVGADILKESLKMARRAGPPPGRGGRRGGFPPGPPGPHRGGRREVRITVAAEDDPRQLLPVTEFETFTRRHDDWTPGTPLSPSQIETVRDLLFERSAGTPPEDDE
jgi:hypothetical protein